MTPNDVKIVADNIDDFIEVPNGLSRLRQAILVLATSGKFAPAGASSWMASRLGEVCSVRKGKKPELYETDDGKLLPYLEAKFIRGTKPAKFARASDKNSVVVTEDDLIIICDGSNSGEFFTGVSGVLASTMGVIDYERELVSKEYLEVFLQSNFELLNKARKGAAIPHLDFDLFKSLKFSIPSVEEQRRIVSKVREVMRQLDNLDAKKRECDEVRARLARSAVQSLGKGESKIAFEHFAELVKTPSDIKELENALLTLAVSGKLVPQNKIDGIAEDLYVQIQEDRTKVEKNSAARKKKAKDLAPISDDEIPFEIPKSWKWVRIGDIVINRDGERIPESRETREGKAKIYDYYGASGVIDKVDDYLFDEPLLLIGEDGANLVNRSTPIAFIARDKYWVNNHAHVLGGISEEFLEYLAIYINSISLLPYITGTAQPKMNQAKMNLIPVALPPLAEQKRIVKKVEEVMVLINRLKQVISEK